MNGRFRWVPYADPLLRPFAEGSWLGYSGGDLTIDKLLRDVGFSHPPPTLTEYRVNIVNATLARWKKSGAVAVKFLCAYARALDFEVVEEAAAAPVYLKASKAPGSLSPAEQKLLEDYLFGAIAAAAGAQQLVVHIHTGNGDGPYFNNERANPGLLENVVASNARCARPASCCCTAAGPGTRVAQAMSDKPNTWLDFSAQTFYLGTHQHGGRAARLAELASGKGLVRLRRLLRRRFAAQRLGREGGADDREGAPRAGDRAHRHDAERRDQPRTGRGNTRAWCCARTRCVSTVSPARHRSESAARAHRRLPPGVEFLVVVSFAFGLPIFTSIVSLGAGGGTAGGGLVYNDAALINILVFELLQSAFLFWFLSVRGWTLQKVGLSITWRGAGTGLAAAGRHLSTRHGRAAPGAARAARRRCRRPCSATPSLIRT